MKNIQILTEINKNYTFKTDKIAQKSTWTELSEDLMKIYQQARKIAQNLRKLW